MRRGFGLLCLALTLAWFALSQAARAVSPPPDGGYPGGNTAVGEDALFTPPFGINNTAIGFKALYSNDGGNNTAIGWKALESNTSGGGNTANGVIALQENTTGNSNTATGNVALGSNTTGSFNTANGSFALQSNTTGDRNTANGSGALFYNTTGSFNTATGNWALLNNTTGHYNTANGERALYSNTTGGYNTANGETALYSNTTGGYNTANGFDALLKNTTGEFNTAIGRGALYGNTTGSGNIALGVFAGADLTTGNNNIDIGNSGVAGDFNRIRIGTKGTHQHTFIAGISGATASGGSAVFVSPNGKLGTATSSKRFKEQIKPMDQASEAILALKPVSFRYKQELDPASTPQFGLVAEEVEKVNPALVARDDEGKAYTVRYEAVNAMLLNEFLKEHRIVQELREIVAKQQAFAAQQQKQIEALTGIVQKVSDQLEVSKPVLQLVTDN